MSTNVDQDAIEFGAHVKQGGWRLGLLVARNVDKGKGNGRPPKTSSTTEVSGKVSAETFAKKSGTSGDRVLRYLKAWDKAAAADIVPASAELVPGEELDGLDVDTLPDWSKFYLTPVADKVSQETRDRFDAAAEAEGTTARTALSIAQNKKGLAAAIKADPAARLAAREAIREVDARRRIVTDPHGKQDAPVDQLVALHIQLRSAKRTLTEALGHVIDLRGVTDTDEVRASVSGYVQQLRHVLNLIDEAAQGKSLDDELAELLEDEELR